VPPDVSWGASQFIEFTLLRHIDLCLTNVRCCWAGVQRAQERQQAHRRFAPEGRRSLRKPSQAADGAAYEQPTVGAQWTDNGLVFNTTTIGTPLDAQRIVNRRFKPLLKRAGLPSICWHDLRHTYATVLLGRGVDPKLVQHLLGHASITMTLDRYSHRIPNMGRHAADGMDEALG
jgi:integrase